ncbi:uncharacterized protein VTP21DRAFT_5987 [Calcarisporiella thermophila]|uniref:uncharacterized protein n=1 Tax=Calcarisporiella thermophila TaxID=911321 RepID=UPI003741F658
MPEPDYLPEDKDDLSSELSYDSNESDEEEWNLQREWEENKEQIRIIFTMVVFPFAGKWLGRKFSFWAWAKWLDYWYSSPKRISV